MKKSYRNALLMTCCLILFLLSGLGCEEGNRNAIKKDRIVATENIQLKGQLNQRNAEVEKLKEQMQQQKEKFDTTISVKITGILKDAIEEKERLRLENEQLKAELEKLKSN